MAEIKVQHKGTSGWMWVVALLIGACVAWALMAVWWAPTDASLATAEAPKNVPEVSAPDVAPAAGDPGTPPAVAAFLTYAKTPVGSPAGPAHEYAADGIRRLAQALNALIEKEVVAGDPVHERLAAFQAKADRVADVFRAMSEAPARG